MMVRNTEASVGRTAEPVAHSSATARFQKNRAIHRREDPRRSATQQVGQFGWNAPTMRGLGRSKAAPSSRWRCGRTVRKASAEGHRALRSKPTIGRPQRDRSQHAARRRGCRQRAQLLVPAAARHDREHASSDTATPTAGRARCVNEQRERQGHDEDRVVELLSAELTRCVSCSAVSVRMCSPRASTE